MQNVNAPADEPATKKSKASGSAKKKLNNPLSNLQSIVPTNLFDNSPANGANIVNISLN